MADPRRYIGVRISEQGHRYIQLVADRDHTNYSAALRHLLALGVRTDMEAHDDTADRTRPSARVGEGGAVRDLRPDGDGHRDRDSGAGSGTVPQLPDDRLTLTVDDYRNAVPGVGDAIGALVRAGLNPAAVTEEDDGPSAA